MENAFDSHKIEERFNLNVKILIEDKFENKFSKDFCLNKILYCFGNEHLKTGFSTQALEKLNIDQIEQLIEHNSEQFECRVNFITEAIYKKPEINYAFFRNITDRLVFDKLKKVPDVYYNYINNSVRKLKKALVIKHIISLKAYQNQYVAMYIGSKTNNYDTDVFSMDNLKKLNTDDLNIINNTLIHNYLIHMEELGDDLSLMLKMQINFTKQQRFDLFK